MNNQLFPKLANAQLGAVRALVDAGANVNVKTDRGMTALHLAASRAGDDVIKYLVEHGAKLDVKDARGNTPLATANSRGAKATAALISELGGK